MEMHKDWWICTEFLEPELGNDGLEMDVAWERTPLTRNAILTSLFFPYNLSISCWEGGCMGTIVSNIEYNYISFMPSSLFLLILFNFLLFNSEAKVGY
jgi:hypothetical protein